MTTPWTGYIEWKGKAMLYLVSGNGIVRRGWTTNKLKNK
jgi:filamentous hemagglutinin family protein